MTLRIPLSRIGPVQLEDVEHSGNEIHNEYARTCTVLQGDPPKSSIGDDAPYRIADLFGCEWGTWNRQFVVQVAGCPLKCWYCYVDNLEPDTEFSIGELVKMYAEFKKKCPDINVFHLMGGCPGEYAKLWPVLRTYLDAEGYENDVLLTDVILLENYFYQVKPWNYIPHRTIVSACLKGTNRGNFKKNTGLDLFCEATRELFNYTNPQVYFSLIEWDDIDRELVSSVLMGRVNWLKVKEYEVVKQRNKGKL